MAPQPFIFPQTKDTTTTTAVESCGAGLWFLDKCIEGWDSFSVDAQEALKKMKKKFVAYTC